MSVCAIMLVKDEADIIATTIDHLLGQGMDEICVMDNASTDGTGDILQELALTGVISAVYDPEVGYYQSDKMSRAAQLARMRGHAWCVPVDADEIWKAVTGETVAERLARVPDSHDIVTAELFDHRCTTEDDEGQDDPTLRMEWRDVWAGGLPKVACRLKRGLVIEMGNHGATYPDRFQSTPGLEIRHFPYRSPEQMIRKARNGAAAYAATDLPEHFGTHWRDYGRILDTEGEDGIRRVFDEHFLKRNPSKDLGLTYDPVWAPERDAPKQRQEAA